MQAALPGSISQAGKKGYMPKHTTLGLPAHAVIKNSGCGKIRISLILLNATIEYDFPNQHACLYLQVNFHDWTLVDIADFPGIGSQQSKKRWR
jgi:hypothetical protein